MKKLVMATVLVLSGLGAMGAYAEGSSMKIAVVDVQQLIQAAPETKTIQARLEKEFKPRQEKLITQSKDLKAKKDKYDRDAAVMSAADRDALKNEIIKGDNALREQAQEYQTQLNDARSKDMQALFTKVESAINNIAKSKQYDLVLAKQAVPYASNNIDITNDVMKSMK